MDITEKTEKTENLMNSFYEACRLPLGLFDRSGTLIRAVPDYGHFTPVSFASDLLNMYTAQGGDSRVPRIIGYRVGYMYGVLQLDTAHFLLCGPAAKEPVLRAQMLQFIGTAVYPEKLDAFIGMLEQVPVFSSLQFSHMLVVLSSAFTGNVIRPEEIVISSADSDARIAEFYHEVGDAADDNEEGTFSAVTMRCRDYINSHLHEPLEMADLEQLTGQSRRNISRHLKADLGMTFSNYVCERRMDEAQFLLSHTNLPVSDIAALLTYCSQSFFTKTFRERRGVTPLQYRQEQADRCGFLITAEISAH